MIDRMLTVGGFTLLSRVTGFARDIILAAVLGAGPVADAFFVALRLPNHFRAIFAEGAFNAAFVPAYARIREQGGAERAGLFADRIFTLLLASQIVLLTVALIFTPLVIDVLAPGLVNDPSRYGLAVELTRITFPYLLLITLVTLYGGILNGFSGSPPRPRLSAEHCAAMALMLAAFFRPPDMRRHGARCPRCRICWSQARRNALRLTVFRWPQLDTEGGNSSCARQQTRLGRRNWLCLLMIIASFLRLAPSALYYADYQLTLLAHWHCCGTVILPEIAAARRRRCRGRVARRTRAVELRCCCRSHASRRFSRA